ncbi:hypothetical protein [Novilysobacter avium]|uniref:Uncharacterized protein n=1 Tax=Novilysobacter avium TaxID=2781023 RepID=A0A7S6UMI5_9GAMM|nr:hypothetical protein [Lysobacter avium]QOW22995.1 hypothetical protein INQ42_05410 [Lysobacter avium]
MRKTEPEPIERSDRHYSYREPRSALAPLFGNQIDLISFLAIFGKMQPNLANSSIHEINLSDKDYQKYFPIE